MGRKSRVSRVTREKSKRRQGLLRAVLRRHIFRRILEAKIGTRSRASGFARPGTMNARTKCGTTDQRHRACRRTKPVARERNPTTLELFLILLLPMARYRTVKVSPEVAQQLAASGIRLTKQREEVFGVLLQKRDHPSATEVFLRAKKHMPSISLATIYNCLEALVDCGLVKQVNLDRAPTRYCANLLEHSHFYCESCGAISDVEMPFNGTWNLPPGCVVAEAEVSLRGLCAKCSADHNSPGAASSEATGLPSQYSKFKLQNSKRYS